MNKEDIIAVLKSFFVTSLVISFILFVTIIDAKTCGLTRNPATGIYQSFYKEGCEKKLAIFLTSTLIFAMISAATLKIVIGKKDDK